MIGPPSFFSQVCRRTLHPAAYEFPLIQSVYHFFSGQYLTPFTRTGLLRGTHSIRAAKRDTIPQAVLFYQTPNLPAGTWIRDFPVPPRVSPGRLSAEVSLSEQLRSWPFPLQTVLYIEGFPARSLTSSRPRTGSRYLPNLSGRFFILMKIRTQLLHSLTVCYSAVKVRGRG